MVAASEHRKFTGVTGEGRPEGGRARRAPARDARPGERCPEGTIVK